MKLLLFLKLHGRNIQAGESERCAEDWLLLKKKATA
jgi:hypothetical protein